MKITKQEDYAILFLAVLASRPRDHWSLTKISDDFNLPYAFLKKIALELKLAGLVQSKEGVGGGYKIAIPANEVTLLEIIEAFQGRVAIVDCADDRYCPAESVCLASQTLKQVNRQLRQLLSGVKLSDMLPA
ncbi:MAG: FeS assembly SUF system regulator, gammaproteobacterial [Candidatus Berkelbacteria bacterium Gr01-1014_85]|uniref:FeS assembly SUF system regulator, gammaproteobacterial n=1 Tax=Candidatus Berkelbacteria bacterium Gr01-1014_85 TaxID=2017150 RepID=A0A554JB10_9BACT|nr:MAG: FeS assembly SUF system regulator, gammaproteobacterial [Candidatus Berkelbacteria bacterium Gr01-1014_85]